MFGWRYTERAGFLFVEGTRMREQWSLKGEGSHRGNLSVHIFKQNLALKDIQRKKANMAGQTPLISVWEEGGGWGGEVRRRINAGRSRTSLYRDELPMIKVAVFVVHYIKSQVKLNLEFKDLLSTTLKSLVNFKQNCKNFYISNFYFEISSKIKPRF